MRVIGGSAKGTKLASVPGTGTRPILDRIKTSLFDILRPEILDIAVLDLFAGSGAVGIEALSQGAAQVTFVEINPEAVTVLRANLEKTHLTEQADMIYIAPPQYQGLWLEALQLVAERPELVAPEGQVIVQIDPKEYEDLEITTLSLSDRRKYGNTELLFYRKAD